MKITTNNGVVTATAETIEHHQEMTPKEWNKLVDTYLATGKMTGDPGILETLDEFQKFWVNETKKSIKRTNK